MNARLDDRLDKATESAVGRFVYKVVLPSLMALVGWLGIRAINDLDTSITAVRTSTTNQALIQAKMQSDVQVIKSQMDYQTRYQTLVDQQQNERLDQHDRALHLK